MNSINVLVNDIIRITVKFVDINNLTGEQTEVDPTSVSVIIKDSDNNTIVTATATKQAFAIWYYDFTPTQPDTYTINFNGILSSGKSIPVSQQLYVSTPSEEYKPTITLRADETIAFGPDISPLYLDPEEIQRIFPEATQLEIAELIHAFSHEINSIFGIDIESNIDPVTVIKQSGSSEFAVADYIKASTACELSRTYGYGGDDELSVQLADLTITNKTIPRSNVTRANATSWCQIAAALRKEIVAKRVSVRGILPKGLPVRTVAPSGASLDPETGALIYINDTNVYGPRDMFRPGVKADVEPEDPMPDRGIKRYD
jgi:hypothetical protein